jgi:hypothetical protein
LTLQREAYAPLRRIVAACLPPVAIHNVADDRALASFPIHRSPLALLQRLSYSRSCQIPRGPRGGSHAPPHPLDGRCRSHAMTCMCTLLYFSPPWKCRMYTYIIMSEMFVCFRSSLLWSILCVKCCCVAPCRTFRLVSSEKRKDSTVWPECS